MAFLNMMFMTLVLAWFLSSVSSAFCTLLIFSRFRFCFTIVIVFVFCFQFYVAFWFAASCVPLDFLLCYAGCWFADYILYVLGLPIVLVLFLGCYFGRLGLVVVRFGASMASSSELFLETALTVRIGC